MGVRLVLEDGAVEVRRMSDYLLVIERGRLASVSDVRRYTQVLEKARDEHAMDLMVVDARVDASRTDPDAREAYWQWLQERPFDRVAIVCEDSMLTTELNMLALSRNMKVRAFTTLGDARAWVMKPSSSGDRLSAVPEQPPEIRREPPAPAE